jgi:hypothetical protein
MGDSQSCFVEALRHESRTVLEGVVFCLEFVAADAQRVCLLAYLAKFFLDLLRLIFKPARNMSASRWHWLKSSAVTATAW